MSSAVLDYAACYGNVGASKNNFGNVFIDAPEEVLALDRRDKHLLLERTLRRLVRHGVLKAVKHQERRARDTGYGRRNAYVWVNRYVRVNVLLALAIAAAEPHELKQAASPTLPESGSQAL